MCMNTEIVPLNAEQEGLLTQLVNSRAHVLAWVQEGKLDLARLHQLADTEAHLNTLLLPMPVDPSEHILAAHAYVHPYLERLLQHDPAHLVVADEEHSYTPRKILRRVLDHALDHLNQIDQWLIWQQQGVEPTPTDGWATSAETFQDDLQPLSQEELQAWLWRVDLAVNMVAQRVRLLNEKQLDWTPPDGGWTLRTALHHLARAEIYYATWLDEPLPDEPVDRYREISSRFEQRLRQVLLHPLDGSKALFNPEEEYELVAAEQIGQMVLAEERSILSNQ